MLRYSFPNHFRILQAIHRHVKDAVWSTPCRVTWRGYPWSAMLARGCELKPYESTANMSR